MTNQNHKLQFQKLSLHLQRLVSLVLLTMVLPSLVLAQQPQLSSRQLSEIKRIYVPDEQLGALINKGEIGGILSKAQFEKLLSQEVQANSETEKTPKTAIIHAADFAVSVDEDRLVGTMTASISAFGNSWKECRFDVAGWNVESATLDDQPAAISRDGKMFNTLRVFIEKPGKQVLKVQISAPLQAQGGDKAISVKLPGQASGEFRLSLPAGKYLESGNSDLDRPAEPDQPATYVLPIGGQTSLNLRITDRQQAARGDVLTFASTAIGVKVFPSEITWAAQSEIQVFGREIDKLSCLIPNTLEITGIESTGLESWELADAPDDQTKTEITLQYRQGFDGRRAILFRGILSESPETPWSVPTLIIPSVNSHTGAIIIQHPSNLRLQAVESVGVRAVNKIEVPNAEATADGSDVHYQIWDEKFSLRFVASLKQQEIQAAMTNILDITQVGLNLYTTASIETRLAPLFDFRLRLPADWEVASLTVDNARVQWQTVTLEDGIQELRIPMNPPLTPGQTRNISLLSRSHPENWPVKDDTNRIQIPEVLLPQVDILEALYGISAEEDFEIVTQEMQGLDPAGQTEIASLNQKLNPIGKSTRLAYTYQDTLFSGQLDISRKPATLSAETLTFFRVDEENLFTRLEVILDIAGGGYRELNVLVSESAGENLRFNLQPEVAHHQHSQRVMNVRLVEQIPGEVTDGFQNWTLRFDRYLDGHYRLMTETRIAREDAEEYRPVQIKIPVSQIVSGYIAVEGAEDEHVIINAEDSSGTALGAVDPVDFPPAYYRPQERVIAGYRYIHPGWKIDVSLNEFDRSPVPTVIGYSANLASVLSKAGQFQHQANIEFVAIGAQSLIIKLPPHSDLWATLLDGAPVEIRQSPAGMQIPLTGLSTGPHQLQLSYSSLAPPLDRMGEFKTTPPALSVIDGQGQQQPVEILSQDWELHLPDETLLISSEGRFEPVGKLFASTFFTDLLNLFRLPGERSTIRRAWTLAWAVLALLIFYCIRRSAVSKNFLTRTGKIAAILIGGFLFFVVCFIFFMPLGLSSRPKLDMASNSYDSVEATRSFGSTSMDQVGAMEFDGEMAEDEFYGGEGGGFGAMEAPPVPAANEPAPPSMQSATSVNEEFRMDNNAIEAEIADVLHEKKSEEVAPSFDRVRRNSRTSQPAKPAAPNITNWSALPQPANQPTSAPEKDRDLASVRFDDALSEDQEELDIELNGRQSRRGRMSTGGLLSMTFDLQIPEGTRSQKFHYQGNGLNSDEVNLRIRYANRTSGRVLVWSIALGIALLGWWFRNSRLGFKLFWTALTVLLPLSLAWIVPSLWQLLLEGTLYGGLGSLALWSIGLCAKCCRCCCGWMSKGTCPASVAFIAAAWLLGSSTIVSAQPESQQSEIPQRRPANFVVIPYSSLDEIDAADRVWVPQEIYRQLWKNAHPTDFPVANGPISAAITEANYNAAVEQVGVEQQVVIQARWVVSALTDGNIGVVLPVTNAAIASVTIDGQAATLDHQKNGEIKVMLQGRGVHVIDAQLRTSASINGKVGEFSVNLLPVASGLFNFKLPVSEDDLRVRVDGLTRVYRRIQNGAETSIQFPIDRGGKKTVNWFPEAQQGGQNQLVQVETAIAAAIDDSGINVTHAFQTRVRQGAINDLTFSIPAELSVRDISGQDIGGWEMQGDADGKELKIFFRREVNDQTEFHINLYHKIDIGEASTKFAVPTITPQDVSRETVQLAVYAANHLKLQVTSTSGLSQIDISRYQPVVKPQQPNTVPRFTYRSSSRPLELKVSVERREAEAKTGVEHGIHIARRKQLIATRIVWQLTGSPRRRVNVAIPDGYLPISVVCAGSSDWYVSDSDAGRVLSIEFPTPKLGRIEAGLEGHLPKQPEAETVEIKLPKPLDVNGQTSTLGIWLDSVYQASISNTGEWNSLRPNQLSGNYHKLDPKPVQFAFRSTEDEPQNVVLNLQTAVPKMTSDVVTLIAVSDATIDYGITLRWNISQAAADQFSFTAPNWLKNIDINGAAIREIQSEDLDDDLKRWTVSLIDPVREQYLLSVAATIPAPLDQKVETPFITTEMNKEQEIQVQQQYAILVNLSPNQLVPVDLEQFESIPLEQIPLNVHLELVQQAMEITRIRDGKLPSWKIQHMEELAVSKAVVLSAHLETVLELDGSWRTMATYGIRNRGRQFLAIDLPENSRVLSVFVRGNPSRTVVTKFKEKTIHLVALPQTSAADLSFGVKILLAGRFDRPLTAELNLRGRRFSIPAPNVLSQQDSEEFGLPVTQTLWTVHLPEEVDAKAITGVASTNLTPHATDAWLAVEQQTLERFQADVSEMARLVNDKSVSKSRRMQANNNLKQLNLSLNNFGNEYYDNDIKSGESVELREKLLGQNKFLQEQAEKAVEEAEPELDEIQDQKPSSGRGYIMSNNSIILDNNGGDGIVLDALSKQSTTFNFLNVDEAIQSKAEAGKNISRSSNSRSKLKSQIAGQKLQLFDAPNVNIDGNGIVDGVMVNDFAITGTTALGSNADNTINQLFSTSRGVVPQVQQPMSQVTGGAINGGRFGRPGEDFGIQQNRQSGGVQLDDSTYNINLNGAFGELTANQSGQQAAQTQVVPWSTAGGLSIKMELPKNSKTLSFSKVGGNPTLTLSVQLEETNHKIVGLVWCLVSLVLGLWILKRFRKANSNQEGIRILANLALIAGLVGFFFLTSHLIWTFFWLFCLAGVVRVIFAKTPEANPV